MLLVVLSNSGATDQDCEFLDSQKTDPRSFCNKDPNSEKKYMSLLCEKYTYISTICPRSSDQFYIVSYYINWVTTSWTNSTYLQKMKHPTIYLFGLDLSPSNRFSHTQGAA